MKITKERLREIIKEEIKTLSEQDNPWAICTASVGRDDKDKFERCVKDVKKQLEEGEDELEEEKDWIQKAVDPEHEGYCTPMTKKTCTPRRKALAKRFKKAGRKKDKQGGTGWQGKV